MDEPVGRYGVHGAPGLEIAEAGDELVLRFPGAPSWLDGRLEPRSDGAFTVANGPLKSAPLTFERDDRGTIIRLSLGGAISFPPHPAADPPDYVPEPPRSSDPQRDAAFDALYGEAIRDGSGATVQYDLPHPRHEFLDDLCRRHRLLLHGSTTSGIEVFEPRAHTLGPSRERSLFAVSACSDGIWAIAYAILDRERARGSFHNGVLPLRVGERKLRLYQFSIHAAHLELVPSVFIDGTVYVFARDSFRRVTDGPTGANSLEFVSEEPVRPLARLAVSPQDFPFSFSGHDDSWVQEALEFIGRMYGECAEGAPLEDGFRLGFDQPSGLAEDLARLRGVFRRFYPWAQVEIEGEALLLTGSAGLRHRIAQGFESAKRAAAPSPAKAP